jgi:hypothetical protein
MCVPAESDRHEVKTSFFSLACSCHVQSCTEAYATHRSILRLSPHFTFCLPSWICCRQLYSDGNMFDFGLFITYRHGYSENNTSARLHALCCVVQFTSYANLFYSTGKTSSHASMPHEKEVQLEILSRRQRTRFFHQMSDFNHQVVWMRVRF